MMDKRAYKIGLVLYLGLIALIGVGAYTGHLPTELRHVKHADKLVHAVGIGAIAFFLEGVLDLRPLFKGISQPRLAPVIVIAAAGAEEYLQRFSARRSSSWGDFIADVIGVVLFSYVAGKLVKKPNQLGVSSAVSSAG